MLKLRKSNDRGHFDHGWLQTWHSFSFGDYRDPEHMGFRTLRVINEDFVQPDKGFGTHGHQDMEIVTWVLDGELEHKDSLGNGGLIRPGEVQRMSAGTGIRHSEFNPSKAERTHLYQIWILPREKGLTPGYEQKELPREGRTGKLQLVASPDGRDGSVTIHQDAALHNGLFEPGAEVEHALDPSRHAWLQLARGKATVNGQTLSAGDGAAISGEDRLSLAFAEPSEILLFDLG